MFIYERRIIMNKRITKICPLCQEEHFIDVDLKSYTDYVSGYSLIQNAFPTFNPMEREFVKTGYCPECQGMLFGTEYTSKLIKGVK
jgi:hypothetical protein